VGASYILVTIGIIRNDLFIRRDPGSVGYVLQTTLGAFITFAERYPTH